ncbi:LYR motif-containing protein 4 isoform 2-T2 [Geothlypis trichas]
MYTAIPRQLSARITCCSFPAPISLSPRRHTNQARGAHTAPLSPPSTVSERCFRFPVARAFPPRPRALHSRTAEPNTHLAAVAPCDPRRSSRAGPTRRNPGTDPESPEPTAAGAAPAREPLFPAPPRPARALRWARAEPRPLPPRSATHRRPCGSAPPRLRPARTARGRGKGASPREERLGVGNMAASSRAQVLRLYRALLRESQRFSCYGYRLPLARCMPRKNWSLSVQKTHSQEKPLILKQHWAIFSILQCHVQKLHMPMSELVCSA